MKLKKEKMLNHPFKIIGLLLAVVLVMDACSGLGDLFTEESINQELPSEELNFKTSYYPKTSGARGENISVSIMNLKPVPATYAFDTSFVSPPSWLKIDANTGTISGKVPENASVGTTKYTIKITGTKQYSRSPEQRLDFVLTLKIADFPDPLRLNVEGMILKKHGNAAEKSGNSMVIDANDSKLTVSYSYSADNATAQPSWLSLNQNTGEIAVTNANQGDLPNIGDAKTYKIRITGTGIYEGKTSEIDFIITAAALEIPADISYDSTTIEKGSNVTVNLSNATGGFTATYAFDDSFAPPPSWLRIDANTGTISGTVPASAPVGTTTYRVNIHGTGAYQGETTSRLFTLTVTPAALPTTLAYDSKTVARGASISHTINGRGGVSGLTFVFAATPAKPMWLNIDPNTGAISGMVPASEPASETTYKIIVNGGSGSIYDGATREIYFTLRVTPAALPTTLAYDSKTVARGASISHTINGRGGVSGLTFVFAATPAKPIWLNIDPNTGAISGMVPASEPASETTYKIIVNGGSGSIYDGATREIYFTLTVSSLDACSAALSVTCSEFAEAYIKASNTGISDEFGYSVALSSDGNTLAVGAYREDSGATGVNRNQSNNISTNSGAVYVFTRSGSTWSQQAYIKASNTDAHDYFGHSVALSSDGNTLAVGAYGEDSNATGVNRNQNNNSSRDSGAVYVFTRSSTTWWVPWSQQAYIKASNTGAHDHFGYSVALSSDGNTLAVGAQNESSNATGVNSNQADNSSRDSGAVYVFTRSSTTWWVSWSQQAYIKASNTGASDHFGYSVAISSDSNTIAVGAYGEDSAAIGVNGNQADNSSRDSGAVYVFTRSSTTWWVPWSQQAYIKASNTGASDHFGYSVAISSDSNTIAVGAYNESSNATGVNGNQRNNNSGDSGAVYVFTRSITTSGTTWSQQAYIKASNTGASDHFGYSVAISSDSNTLAVGARYEDSNATGVNGNQRNNNSGDSGAVYVFTRSITTSGTTWSQQAYIKASNTDFQDRFGYSVTLSSDGNTLAVGAIYESSNATGVNGDQSSNSAANSGAVYIRRIAAP